MGREKQTVSGTRRGLGQVGMEWQLAVKKKTGPED
jgi:hypothetical protein